MKLYAESDVGNYLILLLSERHSLRDGRHVKYDRKKKLFDDERYLNRRNLLENYRHQIRRFTFQFSLKDKEAFVNSYNEETTGWAQEDVQLCMSGRKMFLTRFIVN